MEPNCRKNHRALRNNTTSIKKSWRDEPLNTASETSRSKIAREAASLLYFGLEKEYKQAKVKAAQNLGIQILPSNLEVALELDQIAEEKEGTTRTQQLIEMRKEALQIMKALKEYRPLLIGSVWRGTIRRGSDIDISVYHDDTCEVIDSIKVIGLEISKTERMTITKHGKIEDSFHIHTHTLTNYPVEITVRNTDQAGKKRKCETFGDEIKGLTISGLEKIIVANPSQRFIPS
jgi:predicted nucleotidyltransferase